MTRAEKVAAIQAALAAHPSWTHREIAQALGMTRSALRNLLSDPDGSKQLARRERYRKLCPQCGSPMDGSNGYNGAPRLCTSCRHAYERSQKLWTREAVIAAMQRWSREYGRPPTASDWNTADRPDGYPITTSVYRASARSTAPFGSWSDALDAAGFPRPRQGQRFGEMWWTPDLVVSELQRLSKDGVAPSASVEVNLAYGARLLYGSWTAACAAAGLTSRANLRLVAA